MNHSRINTNGITLHVAQDGPETGELIILLHGFPEFWYGWRRQIPALAGAGYRVWVPDQRGYNESDKPQGIAAYAIDKLSADVIGLMDAAGVEKATVVGHDWGAAVAWWTAMTYPDRVAKLIVLNVPHGSVMQAFLRKNLGQLWKSWYIFFFQIPWLPEKLMGLNHWQAAARGLAGSSRPGTFSEADLAQYRQAWSQPKAFTSMINWYRALIQKPPQTPANMRIHVPTLVLWGAQDKFLSREMAQESMAYCDDGQLVYFEEATHWVQHEEVTKVNELILHFLIHQGHEAHEGKEEF
ncbi:MAG: alpha/beta hydrolase [Anaerolineales bacterium]|nr:alpha/beta hydrolase [Anaerolineales bacterium]